MYNDESHIGTHMSLNYTWRCTVWFFQNIDQERRCTKHINLFISQWYLFENPVVSCATPCMYKKH